MKMLALYLLTCEHRTTEGLYRLRIEYMAADLSGADGLGCDLADSWSPERVRTALARLSDDGFVRFDHAARVVFLPRALAYQAPENPNQRRAAVKSLRELPETPLFEAFLEAARTWCPKLAQAFAQPPGEGLAEPFGERLAEPPAPAPTPTPSPEELVAAAPAATAPLSGLEKDKPAAFADYWAAYPRKSSRQRRTRAPRPHPLSDDRARYHKQFHGKVARHLGRHHRLGQRGGHAEGARRAEAVGANGRQELRAGAGPPQPPAGERLPVSVSRRMRTTAVPFTEASGNSQSSRPEYLRMRARRQRSFSAGSSTIAAVPKPITDS